MGLNDYESPEKIDPMEMSDCENFSVEENAVITAPGYVDYNLGGPSTQTGPFWGGYSFKKSDGTGHLVRQRKNTLEYDSDGAGTWLPCTMPTSGSPVTTVTLTETPCTFASLNDICIWSNGTDTVMSSTDGETWTLQTSLPKSKVVFNNGKNRIIYTAQPAAPVRIDWSDINTPLTIDPTSFQLIDPNNAQIIIGMGLMPDGTNLVFKRGSVYAISDYVDDGIIDVNFIGNALCSSHQSIVTTELSVIFHGYDGIYEVIGGIIRKISGRITPTGRNYITRLDLICGAYYNGQVHMSTPDANIDANYNSQEYIVYMHTGRDDATQPYVITRNRRYYGCYIREAYVDDTTDEVIETLYVGSSQADDLFAFTNDYRDEQNEQGLAGAEQTCYFVTKFFTENVPYYRKLFKKLFVYCKTDQDLDITLSYRFQPYGAWNDYEVSFTSSDLDWTFDDASTGGFSQGFGFFMETLNSKFIDIENGEADRGIQFKVSLSTVNDVKIFSLAYEAVTKTGNFH